MFENDNNHLFIQNKAYLVSELFNFQRQFYVQLKPIICKLVHN